MARSSDDRGEAVRWYLHLLVSQELDRKVPQAEVARRTGITPPQLSLLLNSGSSGGLLALIRYADKSGRSAGELLDEALRWWEQGGRQYAETAIYDMAQKKTAPRTGRRKSRFPAAE